MSAIINTKQLLRPQEVWKSFSEVVITEPKRQSVKNRAKILKTNEFKGERWGTFQAARAASGKVPR